MIKRVIIIGFLIVLLAPAAFIALIQYTDWASQATRVSSFLSQKTGRDVQVSGPLALQIFPKPYLKIGGVTVAAYDGTMPLLKTGEIEAKAALAPLFSMALEIESLTIKNPEIFLSVNEKGVKNWQPKRKSRRKSSGPSVTSFVTSYGKAAVSDIKFTYEDKMAEKTYLLENGQLKIDGVEIEDTKVNLTALALGEELIYTGNLNLSELTANIDFDEEITFMGQEIKARGQIASPFGKYVLNTKLTYKTGDALAFAENFVPLKGTLPITNLKNVILDGKFLVTSKRFESTNFSTIADGLNLSGNFRLSENRYSADIAIKDTDTAVLGYVTSSKTKKKSKGWSDEVIDLNLFSELKVNSKVSIENLVHQGQKIEQANIIFDLTDGMLQLTKADLSMNGGKLDVSGRVDMGTPVRAKLKGQVENFMPQAWYSAPWLKRLTTTLNGSYSISVKGVSVAQMMRSLSGEFDMTASDNEIKGLRPDDLAASMENIFLGKRNNDSEKVAEFNVKAKLDNGVLRTEDLKFDAGDVSVKAEGKLDLGNRAINYKFSPMVEEGIFSVILPVSVRGPLSRPQIIPDLPTAGINGGVGGFVHQAESYVGNMLAAPVENAMDANQQVQQQPAQPTHDPLPFDLEDPEKLRESLQKFLNNAE